MKVLALALLLPACSLQWTRRVGAPLTSTADEMQRCASLDSKQLGWNVASITLGGLAGGSGLTTLAVPDNKTLVYAMGSVSVVVTVGAAVSAYLASHYTQQFCRQCANVVSPLRGL